MIPESSQIKSHDRISGIAGPLLASLHQWVNTELAPRYQRLNRREQWLVITVSCLLPVMLLVFMVILPMQDRQRELRQSVATLKLQAEEAGHLARRLIAGSGVKSAHPINVLADVERIARRNKVREYMTRIRPQNIPNARGQNLMLRFRNAPYSDMIRFVEALSKAKLAINSMKIQAGTSAGQVHVQAVIGTQ